MVNSNVYNTFYAMQKAGGMSKGLTSLLYEKRDLLVKTFANLIVQLGITYYVMEITEVAEDKKGKGKGRYTNILVYLYLLAVIIVLALVPMPAWLKFILFCTFSYGMGYILSGIKALVGEDILQTAMQGTISIFAIMFSLGLFMLLSGIKLGFKTGIFLFFVLLFLIIMRLINNFTAKSSTISKILTIVGIFLFSGYIIYDTNTILQKNYEGDFITASIDYYLDIINLFINLVSVNHSE